jgi:CBS domain-containing protein
VWGVTHDRARAARVAGSIGRFLGMFLVAFGLLALLAGDATGIWLAMIGWFVVTGASAEQDTARLERLAGLSARQAMVGVPVTCPSWWTVATARQRIAVANALQPAFPMIDIEGRAVGAITLVDLQRVPPAEAEKLRVDQIRLAGAVPIVAADASLAEVARAMGMRSQVAVVVDELGRPLGIIDQGMLARALQLTALKT